MLVQFTFAVTLARPEKITPEHLAELLGVQYAPPLSAVEIQRLHKTLPGYQAIVDDTVLLATQHGDVLHLDPAVAARLEQGLAALAVLEPAEQLLEKLRQSVSHQRLQAASQCIEGLLDVARRLREFGNAFPEIKEEGQFLLDFLKAFKPGPKKREQNEGG